MDVETVGSGTYDPPMTSALRVGSVPYLVGRPLDSGLEDEPGIDFVRAVPAKLVQALRDGELDVALVSSIELFRRPGYRYLDEIAVAGHGYVASVQVFLRKPLDEVRTLALDPSSRTARTLVQTLLAERPGGPPHFLEPAPGQDPRDLEADAWLRIGDEALRELHAGTHPHFNPSQRWTETSGLPFVFATWIVRPGVNIEPHAGAFLRARARGKDSILPLADEAASAWGLPVEACREYLRDECLYEPGAHLSPALEAFGAAAGRIGLTDPDSQPTALRLPTDSFSG